MKLESYLCGTWQAGQKEGRPLVDASTGAIIATADATGIDLAAAVEYARSRGVAALAEMYFEERGALLAAIAEVLTRNKESYAEIARRNSGNNAVDAAIDIDGGIFTLKTYARIGKTLGSTRGFIEPGMDQLSREPVFMSRHVWTTRPGVAVQINAFNFRSWGMWEKTAQSLLAGVPSIVKPATSTALLTERMIRDVVASNVLPDGVLSLLCGSAGDLVNLLGPMDSVAFTGSAATGMLLRKQVAAMELPPRLTIEADSVNATIIGPDVTVGSDLFDLAVKEVIKALSVKVGQLCTNIRRVFVPQDLVDAFCDAVAEKIRALRVGDPADTAAYVGPLINAEQRDVANANVARLLQEARLIAEAPLPDVPEGSGFFAPTLLRCDEPDTARAVHEVEVFGPCATILPYENLDQVARLVGKAGGSLALSLFSSDRAAQKQVASRLAAWHGRILFVDEEVGRNHTGHAIVVPLCTHGGPGRAGGGEELGGLRGLRFHMQRTALQDGSGMFDTLGAELHETTV